MRSLAAVGLSIAALLLVGAPGASATGERTYSRLCHGHKEGRSVRVLYRTHIIVYKKVRYRVIYRMIYRIRGVPKDQDSSAYITWSAVPHETKSGASVGRDILGAPVPFVGYTDLKSDGRGHSMDSSKWSAHPAPIGTYLYQPQPFYTVRYVYVTQWAFGDGSIGNGCYVTFRL